MERNIKNIALKKRNKEKYQYSLLDAVPRIINDFLMHVCVASVSVIVSIFFVLIIPSQKLYLLKKICLLCISLQRGSFYPTNVIKKRKQSN